MIWPLLLAAFVGICAAVVLTRVPFLGEVRTIALTGKRAVRAMSRRGASDHWKEKMLQASAWRTIRATGRLIAIFVALGGAVWLFVEVVERVLYPNFAAIMVSPLGLVSATVGAALWGVFQRSAARKVGRSEYSGIEKLMHRLVLGNRGVAEACFDFDQRMTRSRQRPVDGDGHVFVAGLARSGTTALMRAVHDSGQFRSLQYQDMPFVLAPTLWQNLRRKDAANLMKERAHGDGVMVGQQSPECLDEVFWRIFDGDRYIGPEAMRIHRPSDELQRKYQSYVAAILTTSQEKRYLSKNNNNILRLPALKAMFPEAHILLMFRDPLDHASSLLRQHRKFSQRQAQDPFVSEYMAWLAHHEFGSGHLPFVAEVAEGLPRDGLIYWLRQWSAVYARLLDTAPSDALFICYEELCDDPSIWATIAERLGIEAGDVTFKRPRHEPIEVDACSDALAYAREIYARLRTRSALQRQQAIAAE